MFTSYGISITFGANDPARPITPPPVRVPPQCGCRPPSPDDSGGSWHYEGYQFRRDADGRIWRRKLPVACQPQPQPPQPKAKSMTSSWATIPEAPGDQTSGSDSSGLSQSPNRTANF